MSTEKIHQDMPFLPKGQRNHQISQDLLNQLPIKWRNKWSRLDLDQIFSSSPVLSLNVVERANELNDESKIKLKAFTFAAIRDEDES